MLLQQKKKSSVFPTIVLSLVCAVLVVTAVFIYFRTAGTENSIKSIYQVEGLDPSAITGRYPGTPKDVKPSDENVFSYRINVTPEFEKDGTNGKILVQNPSINNYLMVLEIVAEERLLYQSQYIAPNQHIEQIDINNSLDTGEHPAIAYIHAIDPKSLEIEGTLECPLMITIK